MNEKCIMDYAPFTLTSSAQLLYFAFSQEKVVGGEKRLGGGGRRETWGFSSYLSEMAV